MASGLAIGSNGYLSSTSSLFRPNTASTSPSVVMPYPGLGSKSSTPNVSGTWPKMLIDLNSMTDLSGFNFVTNPSKAFKGVALYCVLLILALLLIAMGIITLVNS
jgi:hypothetical protein